MSLMQHCDHKSGLYILAGVPSQFNLGTELRPDMFSNVLSFASAGVTRSFASGLPRRQRSHFSCNDSM